jgi:flagellin
MQANRSINSNMAQVARSSQRVSTGRRINHAGDDPAGLAIATRLRTQVSGLNQANTNAAMGTSMMSVADTALAEIGSILDRVRDLTLNASNDTLGLTERQAIRDEIEQLFLEIDRISAQTSFMGFRMLAGPGDTTIGLQVGANSGERTTITVQPTTAAGLGLGAGGEAFIDAFNDALDEADPGLALSNLVSGVGNPTPPTLGTVDHAINTLNGNRASIGATYNRMQHTRSSIESAIIHQDEAFSLIMDTDIAMELMRKVNFDIMAQAAMSMSSHANMRQSHVLTLLNRL